MRCAWTARKAVSAAGRLASPIGGITELMPTEWAMRSKDAAGRRQQRADGKQKRGGVVRLAWMRVNNDNLEGKDQLIG